MAASARAKSPVLTSTSPVAGSTISATGEETISKEAMSTSSSTCTVSVPVDRSNTTLLVPNLVGGETVAVGASVFVVVTASPATVVVVAEPPATVVVVASGAPVVVGGSVVVDSSGRSLRVMITGGFGVGGAVDGVAVVGVAVVGAELLDVEAAPASVVVGAAVDGDAGVAAVVVGASVLDVEAAPASVVVGASVLDGTVAAEVVGAAVLDDPGASVVVGTSVLDDSGVDVSGLDEVEADGGPSTHTHTITWLIDLSPFCPPGSDVPLLLESANTPVPPLGESKIVLTWKSGSVERMDPALTFTIE